MSKLEAKIKLDVALDNIAAQVLAGAQAQYPEVALNEHNTIVTLRATRNKGGDDSKQGIAAEIEFYPVLVPEAKKHLTVAAVLAGLATQKEVETVEAVETAQPVEETPVEEVKAAPAKATKKASATVKGDDLFE